MRKTNSKEKVCEVCQGKFVAKDSRTRFCSKECVASHASERRKKELALLTKEEKAEWAKKSAAKGKVNADKIREEVKNNTEYGLAIKSKIGSSVKKAWKDLSEEERDERVKLLQANSASNHFSETRSAISKDIKAALVRAGINGFVSEQVFKGKIPDEINHDKKLIIEVFGDYFHANPAIYKDNDYLSLFKCTAKERREQDAEKIAIYEEAGYKTFIIWESAYNNDPMGTILEVIDWIIQNS